MRLSFFDRIAWVAPELYYDKLRSDNKTDAADVYSFGVFLWELFSNGEKPFGG